MGDAGFPRLLELPSFADARGLLTVAAEGSLPFAPKRVFFVTGVPSCAVRGGHGHRRTRQVLVCAAGRCEVVVRRGGKERVVALESPGRAVLLEPADWHLMRDFAPGTVLLVVASEPWDPADQVASP